MTVEIEKNVKEFVNDMKELKLLVDDSLEEKEKLSYITLKYLSTTRITSKGIKTLESLEKDFWNGRKFSKKELLLILNLGSANMLSQGSKIFEKFYSAINEELKQRFDTTEKIESSKFKIILIERGFVKYNPYFIEGLQKYLEKKNN